MGVLEKSVYKLTGSSLWMMQNERLKIGEMTIMSTDHTVLWDTKFQLNSWNKKRFPAVCQTV
jgi:uncharacterized membrane protein